MMQRDEGKERSLGEMAADVCKACMLGDREALLLHIDARPELVNHADDQVKDPAILSLASICITLHSAGADDFVHSTGTFPVALGCTQQQDGRGGAAHCGVLAHAKAASE
jgi:hypothetical protein